MMYRNESKYNRVLTAFAGLLRPSLSSPKRHTKADKVLAYAKCSDPTNIAGDRILA